MIKRFSQITREEWAAFYWSNATGACDSESRFVRGQPRPPRQLSPALAEFDRLAQAADDERRQLPYHYWDP